MIVVDCTVLADWAFGEDRHRASAIKLAETDPVWITSSLAQFELGNVAWKVSRLTKSWAQGAASEAYLQALGIIDEFVALQDREGTLQLACSRKISYYDAAYAQIAISRDLPFYTRDAKLIRSCKRIAMPMPSIG